MKFAFSFAVMMLASSQAALLEAQDYAPPTNYFNPGAVSVAHPKRSSSSRGSSSRGRSASSRSRSSSYGKPSSPPAAIEKKEVAQADSFDKLIGSSVRLEKAAPEIKQQ